MTGREEMSEQGQEKLKRRGGGLRNERKTFGMEGGKKEGRRGEDRGDKVGQRGSEE